jgi:hypothetical protein
MMTDADLNEMLKMIDELESIERRGLPRNFEIVLGDRKDTLKAEESGTYVTRKTVYSLMSGPLLSALTEVRRALKEQAAKALEAKARDLRRELEPKVETAQPAGSAIETVHGSEP